MLAATIQRLNDNPIARAEWALQQRRLDRRKRSRRIFLYAIYVPALLVALIPVFMYITPPTYLLLVFMIAVIAPAQLIVMLRTVLLATETVRREQSSGAWDVLVLSGVSARQIVLGKWWAVLRAVYPEWLLTAFLRLGVAYGMAQLLHLIFLPPYRTSIINCYNTFDSVFCYDSAGFYGQLINPGALKVLSGLAILALLSLLEAGLLTALGLMTALLPGVRQFVSTTSSVFVRAGFVLVILFGFSFKNPVMSRFYQEHTCRAGSVCADQYGDQENYWNPSLPVAQLRSYLQDAHWFSKAAYMGASTLTDGGTRLAANAMRPTPYWGLRTLFMSGLMSLVFASLIYAGLTAGLLGGARWLARRQGALRDGCD